MTRGYREEPSQIQLPRELVLASAGTGKTFTLSSRMMGLLAQGVPPGTILATTFTRKAAGEILDRVLARLARITLGDPRELALAGEVLLAPGAPTDSATLQRIFSTTLVRLIRELHRINVGTLDSFFIRVAKSFSAELEMAPEWTIADPTVAQVLEAEALQAVLAAKKPGEAIELLRMAMKGESGRGVHTRVLAQLSELRELLHQRGLQDPDLLWRPPEALSSPKGTSETDWGSIIEALGTAPLAKTQKGEPDSRFTGALETGIEALEAGRWEAFCLSGFGKAVLAGRTDFSGKEMDPALLDAVRRALAGIAKALQADLTRQGRALSRLVLDFDEALALLQRKEGAYRFQDVTFRLGGIDPLTTRADLWYRLDQETQHLLLDEFQDTSRAQWEALEPLASELLSGGTGERSVVIVADPKQSIYGWRGAEPDLVRRVQDRFALDPRDLTESYRSSKTILELVNHVFRGLPNNPVWEHRPELLGAVERWSSTFRDHGAALDLSGYAALLVGPREEGRSPSHRPQMMAWAAEWIRSLHRAKPGRSFGVLVRRNATVALLVRNLRALGVNASEEGSSSLTDSPAVATALALLRLADHPGDSVAAYQVALSPLGAVVGLADFKDPLTLQGVAFRVRSELVERGYGRVLYEWTRALGEGGALGRRDMGRMLQLVELGHRWDEKATLRPADFVRTVTEEALGTPSDSPVRVMTVHQAKGLEFDAVVLPELDDTMIRGRGRYQAVLPLRDPDTGQVLRIFPKLNKELRPLFPELERAARQDLEGELLDAIGFLYVALTRARQGLYLLVAEDPPDGPPSKPAFSHAGLLRHALGKDDTPAVRDSVLYESGAETWGEDKEKDLPGTTERKQRDVTPVLRLSPSRERRRLLPRRTPSSHAPPPGRGLGSLLSIRGGEGRRTGAIVHRWLEEMTWIEDWKPEPELLRVMAAEVAPAISREECDRLTTRLQGWLEGNEVRSSLARVSYPGEVRVENELAFALRLDGHLVQGRMDRVVIEEEEEVPRRAWILDYKTDAIAAGDAETLERAVESYRGQLILYRDALSSLLGLPREEITASLVFLLPGVVWTLPAPDLPPSPR